MRKLISISAFVACVSLAASVYAGDDVQWKRVQRLDPGARITVTVDSAAPAERYFVQLTDSELVVLNLTVADLPKRQLIEMAKDNPEWMAATAKSIYRNNSVRIGPDGVFVKDRKVCNLNDVVEHIPRSRVTAVKG
jgi:hypothetical protein